MTQKPDSIFVPPQPRLKMNLVENALDSLHEGVTRLLSSATRGDALHAPVVPRDLKHAVLNVAQAVELVLKARLAHDDVSQIFVTPAKAKWSERTVNVAECLARLGSAGVAISEDNRRSIRGLQTMRNQIQRGLVDMTEEEAERLTGQACAFIREFLERELGVPLQPRFDFAQWSALQKMMTSSEERLRLAVAEVSMQMSAADRGEHPRVRLECGLCGSPTVLYPDLNEATKFTPNRVRCHYCFEVFTVCDCRSCGQKSLELTCQGCQEDLGD